MIIRRADTGAGHLVDLRVRGGVVTHVAPHLSPDPAEEVLDAAGGALLPGLHDHHMHLLSLAASLDSVRCDTGDLANQIRRATGTPWIRAIGYHEGLAGPLDRWSLDAIEPTRPVRVQHRSGALWIVNTRGVQRLGLDTIDLPGIERTPDGTPTGRLWRLDTWLHTRLNSPPPNLSPVADLLLSFGVTGVTDATPAATGVPTVTGVGSGVAAADATGSPLGSGSPDVLGAPPELVEAGLARFPLEVRVLGRRKILLHDHDLPSFPELVALIRSRPRPVAVHCVTRESLVLTVAALEEAGPVPRDRIEHGSVVPPELFETLRRLGVRVVTQPTFVADRGDDYLTEVDPDDQPHLYRYASLLAAGIPTAPSSDAPFGDPDPWRTMAAARDRRTRSGKVIGADERVSTVVVLMGFLAPLDDPGGPPRRIEPGAPADICLLHEPLAAALARPSSDLVRRTFTRKEVT